MSRETERRSDYPRCENELYKLPNIDKHIQSERREDELDRLREVREQKRTWKKIFLACLFMNMVFVACAIVGGVHLGY